MPLNPGDVVDGRFELIEQVGAGGMGVVFRARDRATDRDAAVKSLQGDGSMLGRLLREARVLARLQHPGIVSYVAHGMMGAEAYLAMEWLEGVDLSARLAKGPLSEEETLALGERVAAALGAAHAEGVVHRDVKPSNLFLRDGDPLRVVVLDFGIAWQRDATTTRTGMAFGTPAYMAPEQARGDRITDPRTDVYGLGCVLFECLTGHPVFQGDHAMAVLAQVLMSEPPLLSDVRFGVDREVTELVARMLARQPAARPRDGAACASRIRELLARRQSKDRIPSTAARPLGGGEERVVSLVVVAPAHTPEDEFVVVQSAHQLGACSERLRDGTCIIEIGDAGAAVDRARRALHVALTIRARQRSPSPSAVVTGRIRRGGATVGMALDRAASLLMLPAVSGARLDGSTRRLVDGLATLREDATGVWAEAMQAHPGPARGVEVPFVGRDAELARIAGLVAEAFVEPLARAIVIRAGAGFGKSRLLRAALDQLVTEHGAVRVWRAHGDVVAAASPLGFAGQLLADAAGVPPGASLRERRACVDALADEVFEADEHARHRAALEPLMVLGEETKLEAPPEKRLAELSVAWLELLRGATNAQPLLIALDDVQWADAPSLRMLESALHQLSSAPLVLFACGRPEMDELYADLWSRVEPASIELRALGAGSSRRLARALLPDVDEAVMLRVLERGAGHPFVLEELAAAAARGQQTLPDTVLAVAHTRLDVLREEERQVLRAGSLFGRVFWAAAVQFVLGESAGSRLVGRTLDELVARGLVTPSSTSRLGVGAEYSFRHDLLREAVYETVPAEDRKSGHLRVGLWLEEQEGVEPAVLAEHFDRGGDRARTSASAELASRRAVAGDDLPAADRWIDRALATADEPPRLARLHLRKAEIRAWVGDYEVVLEHVEAALDNPAADRVTQLAARRGLVSACYKIDRPDRALPVVDELLDDLEQSDGDPFLVEVVLDAAAAARLYGAPGRVARALRSSEHKLGDELEQNPVVARAYHVLRAFESVADRPAVAMLALQKARQAALAANSLRRSCEIGANLGFVWVELGHYDEAREELPRVIRDASRAGYKEIEAHAKQNLHVAEMRCALASKPFEADTLRKAIAALSALAQSFEEGGNYRLARMSWLYAAEGLVELGELDAADELVWRVSNEMDSARLSTDERLVSYALQTLSAVARDDRSLARFAVEKLRTMLDEGGITEGEALARLAELRWLHMAGDADALARRKAVAVAWLEAKAEHIEDSKMRDRFMSGIFAHASIRAAQ